MIASEGRKIGDVEEDFAQESVRGDIFSLGSMPWQIRGISKNRLMVEPAPGMAPSLPFWQTEAAGTLTGASVEICDLRRHIADTASSSGDKAATDWLGRGMRGSRRPPPRRRLRMFAAAVAALGVVPDDHTLL